MAKRGRPRGQNINRTAVEDLLRKATLSKSELCEAVGITPGHFADMLHRDKGASESTIRAMATVLDCSAETIAPTLTSKFVYVRDVDRPEKVA
jgi:transcriptional regulator with XRE-family HTH domain